MNQPRMINTDEVLVTIKKTLYDLRDIDHKAMSKEEKDDFKKEIKEVEDIALSILDKIKDK